MLIGQPTRILEVAGAETRSIWPLDNGCNFFVAFMCNGN